jgi:hypothetical protein
MRANTFLLVEMCVTHPKVLKLRDAESGWIVASPSGMCPSLWNHDFLCLDDCFLTVLFIFAPLSRVSSATTMQLVRLLRAAVGLAHSGDFVGADA